MTMSSHYLLKSFTDYYQVLARARMAIEGESLPAFLSDMSDAEEISDERQVELLFQKLYFLLKDKQEVFKRQGSAYEQWDNVLLIYILAVLTDELLLLESGWALADYWQNNLMEEALFQSDDAGVKFFDKIDELLSDDCPWKNKGDLSAIFLLAISLGFRGMYRGEAGNGDIEGIKDNLYANVNNPAVTRYLFQKAYDYGISLPENPRLNRISPVSLWKKRYRNVGIALLVLSSLVWFWMAVRLDEVLVNHANTSVTRLLQPRPAETAGMDIASSAAATARHKVATRSVT